MGKVEKLWVEGSQPRVGSVMLCGREADISMYWSLAIVVQALTTKETSDRIVLLAVVAAAKFVKTAHSENPSTGI